MAEGAATRDEVLAALRANVVGRREALRHQHEMHARYQEEGGPAGDACAEGTQRAGEALRIALAELRGADRMAAALAAPPAPASAEGAVVYLERGVTPAEDSATLKPTGKPIGRIVAIEPGVCVGLVAAPLLHLLCRVTRRPRCDERAIGGTTKDPTAVTCAACKLVLLTGFQRKVLWALAEETRCGRPASVAAVWATSTGVPDADTVAAALVALAELKFARAVAQPSETAAWLPTVAGIEVAAAIRDTAPLTLPTLLQPPEAAVLRFLVSAGADCHRVCLAPEIATALGLPLANVLLSLVRLLAVELVDRLPCPDPGDGWAATTKGEATVATLPPA